MGLIVFFGPDTAVPVAVRATRVLMVPAPDFENSEAAPAIFVDIPEYAVSAAGAGSTGVLKLAEQSDQRTGDVAKRRAAEEPPPQRCPTKTTAFDGVDASSTRSTLTEYDQTGVTPAGRGPANLDSSKSPGHLQLAIAAAS